MPRVIDVQKLPDGRVSLQSEDATVRVVLHPGGKRFAACFPLLVHTATSQTGPNAAPSFSYFWQTQVFATADFPARWTYPVRMAQAALENPSALIATSEAAPQPGSPCMEPSQASSASATSAAAVPHTGPSRDTQSPEPLSEQLSMLSLRQLQPGSPGGGAAAAAAAQPSAAAQSLGEREATSPSGTAAAPADGGDHAALERATAQGGSASPCGGTAAAAEEAPSVLERTTHLPQAAAGGAESPNFFAEGSWWTECSLDTLPDDVRPAAAAAAPASGTVSTPLQGGRLSPPQRVFATVNGLERVAQLRESRIRTSGA